MELQFERRTRQDRRKHMNSPRFPFVDGKWKVVSNNRRARSERRQDDTPIDEKKILNLLQKLTRL